MKATIELDLKPFMTPNFVQVKQEPSQRQEGMKEPRSFALSELDENTLERLCENFTNEVFKKAGKTRPTPSSR